MVDYYTLHTIVYNRFYVLNSMRRPVLVSSNQLQLNCSLNWFEPFWTGFFGSYHNRQPVSVVVHPNGAKKLDWTGPLNTTQEERLEWEGFPLIYISIVITPSTSSH